MRGERRPSMLRRARRDTSAVVRERPVITGLATALAGAAILVAAWFIEDDLPPGWQIGLIVASSGLGAFLLVLVCLFIAKLVTARRHQVEDRVTALETQIGEISEQVLRLTQDKLGERDRFVPTYHDLRADLREAKAKIEMALKTGRLWAYADSLGAENWKDNKEQLASHQYAKEDGVYGPCLEAFMHIERLTRISTLRFVRREVRQGDNLDAALAAIATAEDQLTAAISKNRPSQP
jgi:hypothetical protein